MLVFVKDAAHRGQREYLFAGRVEDEWAEDVLVVSASPTVSFHAARRASFIASTLWNGLLQ